MNAALPPWASRAAAVTLLAAVLGALYLYAAVPLIATYRDTDEEIARTRELLARYEQVAAQRPVKATVAWRPWLSTSRRRVVISNGW